ncbi:MAG: MarR family transcriptional regulator [Desulfomonile tiedjei]|uniref:MarR family transcriptional regulator n=1 Tax=Desulfomonile tiedjei TaxID=2358 RepID=A0A9D6Z2C3_9BACT|nr:MarR family transcriptional regulator [Desulfomonile tiedjei]
MELRFSVFPRNESPGFVIYLANCRMKAALQKKFESSGLTVTPEQWAVLSSLWEEEGIHQSLLAEKTTKDRHNIARIVKLLERGGLVRREPDGQDGRLQRVYLTEEGWALKSRLVPVVNNFLQHALSGLTQEDLDSVRRILGTIVTNLAELSGGLDEGTGPQANDNRRAIFDRK